jgi:hypothetical protein
MIVARTNHLATRRYSELWDSSALELWDSKVLTTTHSKNPEHRTGELPERCYLKLHYFGATEL